MDTLRHVHIVPTYQCNLTCSYCYASKYIPDYPHMTWAKFKGILDMLVRQNIQKVSFIGGEPTIWKDIDRAIDATRAVGMHANLLTNAVRHTTVVPHSIMINGTNLTEHHLRPFIEKNLAWYRQRHVQIGIRFNIATTDGEAEIARYVAWAREFADNISFSPIVPYELDRKMGGQLYAFVQAIRALGKPISLARAVPLCIFTPTQLDYMEREAGLYSRCAPAHHSMVINPDGTVLPCVDLNLPKKVRADDLPSAARAYAPQLETLFNTPRFGTCATCPHFPTRCQGGCLAINCPIAA